MVIFLNFAPFRFMGGAEKWFVEIAKEISKNEKIKLISVSPSLANIYSSIILGRKFNLRSKSPASKNIADVSLDLLSFLPFSKGWTINRKQIKEARIIYLKFEILEILIALYFGGPRILKKTIGGFHSPFVYTDPVTFFDRFHNFVYQSKIVKYLIKKLFKVHVITLRDFNWFKSKLKVENIIYFPNIMDMNPEIVNKNATSDDLNIIFVGELSSRKGVDVLREVVEKSDRKFNFDIVGDGAMQKDVLELERKHSNVKYHNYLNHTDLFKLYAKSDVLFLPSRAEGFPVVFLEAIAHGLVIVDSEYVTVGLPDYIEHSSRNNPADYINQFIKIKNNKKNIKKNEIIKYYNDNFSFSKNKYKLIEAIFN